MTTRAATIDIIVGDYGNFDSTKTIHTIAEGSTVGDLAEDLPKHTGETAVIVDPFGHDVNQANILCGGATFHVRYVQEREGSDMSSAK